jgi:membrane protease YdiL (CAAX protease family)
VNVMAGARELWTRHLRGHFLRFDGRPAPVYPPGIGSRLLLTAALLETTRVAAIAWLRPEIPLWALLPSLLALAVLSVPVASGLAWDQIGFRRWGSWSVTERSYFLQVLVVASVVFPLLLGSPLADRASPTGAPPRFWTVFVPYLFYGFYQELVYRGMIQTELVRRWGPAVGIVASNMLYTFGPLHWSYFAAVRSFAAPMFAAIFAIGLFFGVLFHRSGNLWLAATFHAIGNAFIVSSIGSITR